MKKKNSLKRHQKQDLINLMNEFSKEFSNIDDIRFYSIICHQYIDYFLNEILIEKLPDLAFIIDDTELGIFRTKLKILKSANIFDNHKDLIQNIEKITKIRNFYAHNMMKKGYVPKEIKKHIDGMRYPKLLKNELNKEEDLLKKIKFNYKQLSKHEVKFRIISQYSILEIILISKNLTNEFIVILIGYLIEMIFDIFNIKKPNEINNRG